MLKISVIKVSSKADLESVFAIRRKVFVEEQACPPELEWENEDVSVHFLAKLNGEDAGACRWRKTEDGYKIERLAVLKRFRGKGIASEMIKAIFNDLPKDAKYIYMHAQITAMSVYERSGFLAEGPRFEEAGIQHFKMVFSA